MEHQISSQYRDETELLKPRFQDKILLSAKGLVR